jgi:hypothetical protein
MKKTNKKPIVLVEWTDSVAPDGWTQIDNEIENEKLVCHSVGMILRKDDVSLTVASTVGMFDEHGPTCAHSPMTIPVSAVRKITTLVK